MVDQVRAFLIIETPIYCNINLVTDDFDYVFAENGLTAYKAGVQLPSQSFIKHLGEEKYKHLVKFILHYLADLEIPIKRYLHFAKPVNDLTLLQWHIY